MGNCQIPSHATEFNNCFVNIYLTDEKDKSHLWVQFVEILFWSYLVSY